MTIGMRDAGARLMMTMRRRLRLGPASTSAFCAIAPATAMRGGWPEDHP